MRQTIQSFVFPDMNQFGTEDMYFRTDSHKVLYRPAYRTFRLPKAEKIRFDTFFNGLTIRPWKTCCPLDDLWLALSGTGKALVSLNLHRLNLPHRLLSECEVDLSDTKEVIVPVEAWNELSGGMLYVTVRAVTECTLSAARFFTETPPASEVRLGVVITHFNRKSFVVPAIKRIRDELLRDPCYAGKIELVVVDNSRNLTPRETEGITCLPNENFGGSGGFARGLMHLSRRGDFTHCLFMDDDASCELESLRRTFALMSYSVGNKFAVAGSLLRENEPYRLIEKGAVFSGLCRPLMAGLDMRNVHELLLAESSVELPNYGAWWFFGFRISDVESYPFPFFVRGDDITFSLMNGFRIMTMNGIGCWGEDFSVKSGPLPIYLDVRSTMFLQLVMKDYRPGKIIRSVLRTLKRQIQSYNYASADSVVIAMLDFCSGPDFWLDNIDLHDVRNRILSLTPREELTPREDLTAESIRFPSGVRKKLLDRVLYGLLLKGLIVPRFVLRDTIVYQHKAFHGNPEEIFRSRKILYFVPERDAGYIAQFDGARARAILFKFIAASIFFLRNYQKISEAYAKAVPNMASEAFWADIYGRAARTSDQPRQLDVSLASPQ